MPALLGAALVVTVLAGCDSSTTGEPSRDPSSTSETRDESTDEGPSATYSVNDLCGLLSEDEVADLGAKAEPRDGYSISDGHPQCDWPGEEVGLTIGWSEGRNTSQVKTGPTTTITPTTVHGLKAVQSRDTNTIVLCQVLVDLPDGMIGSAVSLTLVGEGKYDECKIASDAMNIIIPKVTEK